MGEGDGDMNLPSLLRYANLMSLQLALRVVIESNILNTIASAGPSAQLSTLEIASQIPASNPNSIAVLDQLLRFLAVKSLLTSSLRQDGRTRTFGLTDVTRYMVTVNTGNSSKEPSIAPLVMFGAEGVLFERINMLRDAILDPENSPFFTPQRVDIFELSPRNPSLNKSFNDLMSFWTRMMVQKVLAVYKGFEEVNELLDVGGGMGTAIQLITSAYPHIHGINFDLPHVIADAPHLGGVKHVAGDMFVSLPKSETIWIKAILHDWDDERCTNLLRNCWEALPEKGKVIALEIITPEDSSDDPNLSEIAVESEFYVRLLNLNGRERTAKQFDELARAGGFTETKIFHIWDRSYLIEFLKN